MSDITNNHREVLFAKDEITGAPFPVEGTSADGALNVNILGGAVEGGGGTQYDVDTVAGAAATGTLGLYVRDDTLTTLTPADGDYTQGRVDAYGARWVSLATKLNSTDDAVSAVVTDVTPGTGASSLGKAEDAAHTTGDVGVMALGVRNDANATIAGTTLDYSPFTTDISGAMRAVGNVAAASTDSGNPIKVGGKYNSTLPTYTDGQRGDVQVGTKGSLNVQLLLADSATGIAYAAGNVDNITAPSIASRLQVMNLSHVFNGTSFDRQRSNEEATLLASAARTTTQTGSDITNYNGTSSLIVVVDVTSAGTGSITMTVEGKDSASSKYYTILSGAAIVTNSTNRYKVSPTIAAVANSIAQDIIPRIFRITITANNVNSVTYSVGYNLIRG